jgi:D-amino peptidase
MIVDMEGISGVVHGDQLMPQGHDYARARQWLTDDLNAAIEGAVAAGAERVVVAEGHAGMRNVLLDQLHARAEVIYGPAKYKPLCQFHEIEGVKFDAAVFVGFHAMAGDERALLAHTWSGAVVHHVRVNGKTVGETAINAALCGHHGIPLVAVTGDDQVCREARETVGPWVRGVEVKRALGSRLALCPSTRVSQERIRTQVREAVAARRDAPVFRLEGELAFEVGFHRVEMASKAMRVGLGERVGDREIAFRARHFPEGAEKAWSLIVQAMLDEATWLG